MDKYNLGDFIKYEVWLINHRGKKHDPNRIDFITNDLDKAMEYQVPAGYEKVIVREKTTRRRIK